MHGSFRILRNAATLGLIFATLVSGQEVSLIERVDKDPTSLDLEVVVREEGLDAVYEAFATSATTKSRLPALERYFTTIRDAELVFMQTLLHLKRSEFDAIRADFAVQTKMATLHACQWDFRERVDWKPRRIQSETESNRIPDSADLLLSVAKERLEPTQLEQLEQEVELRRQRGKKATINGMMIQLDAKLSLTPEQRKEIRALLDEAWRDEWLYPRLLITTGVPGFSGLPKQSIRQLMNRNQRVLFDAINWIPIRVRTRWHPAARMVYSNRNVADELSFAQEGVER